MRVLHTADVHLREDDPDTVDALETLLATAEEHDVGLLTIGGDLFDTPEAADVLRPRLRRLFGDTPFDVLAIPGNHDAEVYEENLDFGDVDVLVDEPLARRYYDDVSVVGVPYTSHMTEDLFAALAETDGPEETRLLLLHCTLDIGFNTGDVGDEATTGYFPVSGSTLAKLDYDYVLAGHIHSATRHVPLANGGEFIYPGSPVSHSSSETGRRHAVLVDTEREQVTSVPLETFYVDRFTRTVRPGEEDDVIDAIDAWVEERDVDDCDLRIEVDGFIEQDETAFRDALESVAGTAAVTNETRDVSDVHSHPLYQQFLDELEAEDDGGVDDREAVDERVIQVLSQLLARREIRP